MLQTKYCSFSLSSHSAKDQPTLVTNVIRMRGGNAALLSPRLATAESESHGWRAPVALGGKGMELTLLSGNVKVGWTPSPKGIGVIDATWWRGTSQEAAGLSLFRLISAPSAVTGDKRQRKCLRAHRTQIRQEGPSLCFFCLIQFSLTCLWTLLCCLFVQLVLWQQTKHVYILILHAEYRLLPPARRYRMPRFKK